MTHISRALLGAIVVLVAGCTSAPPKPEPTAGCPQCPPLKPAPETARYQEVPFDALPGWKDATLVPSLRALLVTCGRPPTPLLVASELAAMVPADHDPAARRLLQELFSVYSITSSRSTDSGMLIS